MRKELLVGICIILFVLLMFESIAVPAIGSENQPVPQPSSPNTPPVLQEPSPVLPIPSHVWDTRTKVWVARSCVGEAGFEAADECTAIAWVYAKRSKVSGLPFLNIVRRYSAAIKRHSLHQRPWLLELNSKAGKPKSWPDNVSWTQQRDKWKAILNKLDQWSRGQVKNLVPRADHYGSRADARRALFVWKWKRLPAPSYFKNWFFDSTRRAKMREIRHYFRPRVRTHAKRIKRQ